MLRACFSRYFVLLLRGSRKSARLLTVHLYQEIEYVLVVELHGDMKRRVTLEHNTQPRSRYTISGQVRDISTGV